MTRTSRVRWAMACFAFSFVITAFIEMVWKGLVVMDKLQAAFNPIIGPGVVQVREAQSPIVPALWLAGIATIVLLAVLAALPPDGFRSLSPVAMFAGGLVIGLMIAVSYVSNRLIGFPGALYLFVFDPEQLLATLLIAVVPWIFVGLALKFRQSRLLKSAGV